MKNSRMSYLTTRRPRCLSTALLCILTCGAFGQARANDFIPPRDEFEHAIDQEIARMKLVKRHFVDEMASIRSSFVRFGHDDMIKNEALDEFRNDLAKSFIVTKADFDSHMAAHVFNKTADPFDIFELSRDLGIFWGADSKPTVVNVQRVPGKSPTKASWTVSMPESLGETFHFDANGDLQGQGTYFRSAIKSAYMTSTIQADALGNKLVTLSPYVNTIRGPSDKRWQSYTIAEYLGGRIGKVGWLFPADHSKGPTLTDLSFALPPLPEDLAHHERFPEMANVSMHLELSGSLSTAEGDAQDVIYSMDKRTATPIEKKLILGRTKMAMAVADAFIGGKATSTSSLLLELASHVPSLKSFSVRDLYRTTATTYLAGRQARDKAIKQRHMRN